MSNSKRTFDRHCGTHIDVSLQSAAGNNTKRILGSMRADVRLWQDVVLHEEKEFVQRVTRLIKDGMTDPQTYGPEFLRGCAEEELRKQTELERVLRDVMTEWGRREINKAVYTVAAELLSAKPDEADKAWVRQGPTPETPYEAQRKNKVYRATVCVQTDKNPVYPLTHLVTCTVVTNSPVTDAQYLVQKDRQQCACLETAVQAAEAYEHRANRRFFHSPDPIIPRQIESAFRLNGVKLPGFRYQSDNSTEKEIST